MVPHDVRNVREEPVRVVGCFAGAALVHRFSEPLLPEVEEAVFTHRPGGAEAPTAAPVGAPGSAEASRARRRRGRP